MLMRQVLYEQHPEVANAKRHVTDCRARLMFQLDRIQRGDPFDLSAFEEVIVQTEVSVRELVRAEEQARKGAAA
jgi:hypothetical protein